MGRGGEDSVIEVIGEVSRALVGATTEPEIQRRLCEQFAASESYSVAWVGRYNPEDGTLTPAANAGFPEHTLDGSTPTADTPQQRLATEALDTRAVLVRQDLVADPPGAAWHDHAETHGYQSYAVVPLVHEEFCYGVLHLATSRPRAFGPTERELLAELGRTIAYSCRVAESATETATESETTDFEDGETAQQGVTAETAQGRRLYETIISSTPDLVYAFDLEYRFIFANDALLDMWGQTLEESIGKSLEEIGYEPWHAEMHEREIDQVIETREPVRGEVGFEHATLGPRIYDYIFAPVLDDEGDVEAIAGTTRDITERKEIEDALQQSKERFRTLVTASSDVVYRTDPSSDEMQLLEGQEFVTESGESTSEWIERYIHPADRDRVRDTVEEANRTKSTFEMEHRVEQPDGTTGWVFSRAVPMLADDGAVVEWIGMAQDITDQKERERKLERALDLLEKTEHIADVGGWEIDVETQEVFWTDHIFELLEIDADEEPPLEDALALYHEDDRPRVETAIENALNTGESFELEARIRTAGGEMRWARLQGLPETVDGAVVTLRGTIQDVTDRKQREAELERRARQQDAIADLGQFALETEDLDDLMDEAARRVADVLDNDYCKVLDLDEAANELLLRQGVGWRAGVVGDATVSADEADSQAAYTLANDHPIVVTDLETETRFSGPALLRSHDVRSGVSTVIGPFNEPWGILGTHDTEPRVFTDEDVNFVQSVANILAEAIERHQYQAELEELVADLEESNERLEQFAYAASHDLQEPLRMVSSYLQMIERRYEDDLDDDGREFLEFAVDGAERMRNMIDALLRYSRVETQGDPLKAVDLDAVLEGVLDDLQVKIEETDAEITVEELPRVEGDANQLRQVFLNLIDNALEYSGEDSPSVAISAARVGGEWAISVEDEGIGIDPDDTDRIFQVFQRLHSQEAHAGTGIGLALCERIVERHGGDIWADSEPGEGTTFSVTLPVADTPNPR